MNMTGNTILIACGGSGIRRGLAEAFHKLGNQVIISGHTQKKLDETTAANPGMKALTLNIAVADSITAFAAKVIALLHKSGILCVCSTRKLVCSSRPSSSSSSPGTKQRLF